MSLQRLCEVLGVATVVLSVVIRQTQLLLLEVVQSVVITRCGLREQSLGDEAHASAIATTRPRLLLLVIAIVRGQH